MKPSYFFALVCQMFFFSSLEVNSVCGFQLGNLVPPRWADSHLWLEFALANLLTGCFPNPSAIDIILKK